MAAEAGAEVFSITAASVTGAYLGESERRLREVFKQAESVGASGRTAIVFLDEVDALCPKRMSGGGHESRVTAQLLTLLDGAASTNLVRCARALCHAADEVAGGDQSCIEASDVGAVAAIHGAVHLDN